MLEVPVSLLMAAAGFAIGGAFGATARLAEFCTLGAIADAFLGADRRRLRSWFLAIAVALLLSQAMDAAGWIDLRQSIYLTADLPWLGAILGGLCFGFGMALVGTCGYGALVRLGGGDLRYLVVAIVLGVAAHMTLGGLFGALRVSAIEATNLTLASDSQGLPDLLAQGLGLSAADLRWPVSAAVIAGLLLYCFADRGFRASPAALGGGVVMGLLVAAAWYATGVLGADDFDPAPLRALSFVTPVGDTLLYLMTFTGSTLDFGIGSVAGVVAGAFLANLAKGTVRLEGFDGRRELTRHLSGAVLMGFGGVTALGCTVGQGISAVSALALSGPLALAAIFLGAYLGLRFLEKGRLWGRASVFSAR